MKTLFQLALIAFSSSFPKICFAEVMDKAPSLEAIWIWAILGCLAGLVILRSGLWLIIVTLPLPTLFFVGLLLKINHPDVGPAIKIEAGNAYIISAYVGIILVFVGHILGYILGKRQRKAPK